MRLRSRPTAPTPPAPFQCLHGYNTAYTRGGRSRNQLQRYCRGDRRRINSRDDRPVYTLQAIVAATIASWLLDSTDVRRRDDRL